MLDFTDGGRILRKNHQVAYPTRMLILDTETYETNDNGTRRLTFRLGWTVFIRVRLERGKTARTWKYWRDREALLDYIESLLQEKKTLYLYAHNAFFDMQVIGLYNRIGYLPYTEDFYYGEPLTFLHFLSRGSAHLKIVSTTNYFDCKLKELGDAVGLPKLGIDFKEATDEELCTYCRRDVEILDKALSEYMAFNRFHNTGKFGNTKASQAFNCFRHRFMDKRIMIHQDPNVVELERSAYFGGRTEAWQLGEIKGGETTFLDVNSMYPAVMREHRYPVKLRFYFEGEECALALKYLNTHSFIAEVTLSTSEPVYAVRHNKKLIFPTGTFRTFLCTGGLERAIEKGHLKQIHRIAVYENQHIFKEYVDYWYPLKVKYRTEGNVLYTRIVKLFLNSLYGKFGQKQPITETWLDPEAGPPRSMVVIDDVTGERYVERSAFGKVHRQIGEKNGNKSFVAIAAHVTEYSRFALWDMCAIVGRKRIYYMDTDSICLLSSDVYRLERSIHPERLGALSAAKVCQKVVFHGAKHYQADEERVLKGVPKTATQTGEFTYAYDQFLGSKSHQRLGENGAFLIRRMIKNVTPAYDKGEVLPSGRVIPWVLNEP